MRQRPAIGVERQRRHLHLGQRPRHLLAAQRLHVGPQERDQHDDGDDPGHAERDDAATAAPSLVTGQRHGAEGADDRREVRQVVHARQGQRHPGGGRPGQRPARSGPREHHDAGEGERGPLGRQRVQVRQRDQAVDVEAEEGARRHRPGAAAGQREHELKGAQRREPHAGQEGGVVGGDRRRAGPVQRQHQQGLRDEVLRVGERPRFGREDRRVPHPRERTGVAAEDRGEVPADPRHHPGDEQRIAEIAGQTGGQVARQGPGRDDGERRETQGSQQKFNDALSGREMRGQAAIMSVGLHSRHAFPISRIPRSDRPGRRGLAGRGRAIRRADQLSRPRSARAHPPRTGAAGEELDHQAVRHRAPDADGPRGHRHVDHRVARVQRRPGVPVDGAADHLFVAAADHPRVRQPRRRPAGRALLDWPLRLRQALHDGAHGERRAVGGAADAGRAEGPQGHRRQRVGALEPRRRAHRQREAAAARRRWARSTRRG